MALAGLQTSTVVGRSPLQSKFETTPLRVEFKPTTAGINIVHVLLSQHVTGRRILYKYECRC